LETDHRGDHERRDLSADSAQVQKTEEPHGWNFIQEAL
jgi:hypothetical protein